MKLIKTLPLLLCTALALPQFAPAQTLATRMPPRGVPVPEDIRSQLDSGTLALGQEIADLKIALAARPELLELLPDVQIYFNAVRYALEDEMFYKTNDFALAKQFLAQGRERAAQLRAGHAPWNTATGLVVRGYVSRLDGSVIPYGLVVPETYQTDTNRPRRLDLWFHGRGEQLGELSFINDRQKNPGEFTPADTFVLHPYGRYCNGFKFGGEVDVFEALDHARRHYPIESNHISVRGFSMGGAATWHLGVHHAGDWSVVAPGAGFVDTAIFTKAFDKNPPPTWYEQKLWHYYDAMDYAANLFNTHVVAYSGEIDGQRAAAELMTKAMADEGMTLTHIIGPKTGHKYEPEAKKKVAELVDGFANAGRNPLPKQIKFTTWNLRWNEMDWLTVDGLDQEWERARVNAEITGDSKIVVTTTNVSALTFAMPAGLCPLSKTTKPVVSLDGQDLTAAAVRNDGSWTAHFKKVGAHWAIVKSVEAGPHEKRHGLQGPIDDAFMDSFIMVRPTGQPLNDKVGQWAVDGLRHAMEEWHLQFRGEARLKDDRQITSDDMASNNLILFGDPKSNRILAKLATRLPIKWDASGITIGSEHYSSDTHAPVLIYPNPLNPKHYIVLNTGFTFCEVGRPSNALQNPVLPDYAVVDITVPIAKRIPSGIVTAGFFDEQWQLGRKF